MSMSRSLTLPRLALALPLLAALAVAGSAAAAGGSDTSGTSGTTSNSGATGTSGTTAPGATSFSLPAETAQLLVVTTPDWSAVGATLTRYRRIEGRFIAEGAPVPAVVGKSGLAWGLGLHPPPAGEPVKREGDGRAPAGVFRLGGAMGYAAAAPAGSRWPYQASGGSVCVDDPAHPSYNRIVGGEVPPTWGSAEKMTRSDGLYRWLVLVDHNPTPVPGSGSCIFLHIWRAADKGTLGCTATAEDALVGVLGWLDPAAEPLLVQLPSPTYAQVAERWGLPR